MQLQISHYWPQVYKVLALRISGQQQLRGSFLAFICLGILYYTEISMSELSYPKFEEYISLSKYMYIN